MSFFGIRGKVQADGIEALKKKLNTLREPLNPTEAGELGDVVVTRMRDVISKGISPIIGPGISTRFAAYKNPDEYPGRRMKAYPGKRKSPVNLFLTGEFMASLSSRVVKTRGGFGAEIGYDSRLSGKKEQGHREGVNGQPSRPTIPDAKAGERFSKIIQDEYLKVMNRAIKRVTQSR